MRPPALSSPAPVEVRVPTTLDGMDECLAALGQWLDEQQAAPRARYTVELAIEELLNNVRMHGFDEDPEGHQARVLLSRGAGGFVLVVEDDGRPFDPSGAPAPAVPGSIAETPVGGLGIQMIRRRVDDFRYERRGGHNVVTLAFANA